MTTETRAQVNGGPIWEVIRPRYRPTYSALSNPAFARVHLQQAIYDLSCQILGMLKRQGRMKFTRIAQEGPCAYHIADANDTEAVECSAKWTVFEGTWYLAREGEGLTDNVLRMPIIQCCADIRAVHEWGLDRARMEEERRAESSLLSTTVELQQRRGEGPLHLREMCLPFRTRGAGD